MNVVVDRRTPTTSETSQMWLNIVASVLTVTPMLMTSLKPMLPEHYYGVLASLIAAANAALEVYKRLQYGKIITIEPVEERA